jgi:hypothetical protein
MDRKIQSERCEQNSSHREARSEACQKANRPEVRHARRPVGQKRGMPEGQQARSEAYQKVNREKNVS